MSSLGHRRIMLAALGELVPGATTAERSAAVAATAPRHRRAPPSHRDVLGPRRFDGTLGAHGPGGPARDHFRLSEVRRRDCAAFGGFVAKYMGDGVLVYFGYPQAHEDDAERAVRAGLELIQAVGALEVQCSTANPRGHCHRVGRGRRSDRNGFGSGAGGRRRDAKPCGAPARGCGAEHGRHCGEHAEAYSAGCSSIADLGTVTLKGFDESVPAWELIGRARPRAGSRLCVWRLRRWSAATRRWRC